MVSNKTKYYICYISVCENCKPKLESCPVCRSSLLVNQNTVAGQICMIINHKCKYEYLGCKKQMKLPEIDDHEKRCPERLINCPFRKKFNRSVSNIYSIETFLTQV